MALKVGAKVYIQDEAEAFLEADVVKVDGLGADAEVQLKVGAASKTVKGKDVIEADPKALAGVPDMQQMDLFTEASLLGCLRVRYQKSEIYSAVGETILAMNPFKVCGVWRVHAGWWWCRARTSGGGGVARTRRVVVGSGGVARARRVVAVSARRAWCVACRRAQTVCFAWCVAWWLRGVRGRAVVAPLKTTPRSCVACGVSSSAGPRGVRGVWRGGCAVCAGVSSLRRSKPSPAPNAAAAAAPPPRAHARGRTSTASTRPR